MSTFFDNPGFNNFIEFSEEPMEYDVGSTAPNYFVPPVQWTTNFTQNPPQNFDFNGTLFSPTHTHYPYRPIQDPLSLFMDGIQFETTGIPPANGNGWGVNVHPQSYQQDLCCVSPKELSGHMTPSSHVVFDSHGFSASNTSQYGSAMGNPYGGMNYPPYTPSSPSSNSVGMQPQPFIPPVINHTVPSGPLNPRARRPTPGSSRTPRRTSSLPVSPRPLTSFSDPAPAHSCQWVNPDGSLCGGQITKGTISEHLVTHGIHKMTHNHPIACCWMGCRPKRRRTAMNRESIARHIREVHLGYRRTL